MVTKRVLSLVLSILLVVSLLPGIPAVAGSSAEILAQGTCGTNAFWTVDSVGTLTISGTGKTNAYSLNFEQPSWDEYRPQIINIVIEDGITSIGEWLFCNCSEAVSITIPPSVRLTEYWCFYGCSSLRDVYITDLDAWCSIEFGESPMNRADNMYLNGELITEITIPADMHTVGEGFSGWDCLTSLTIPETVTEIGFAAFSGCSGLTEIIIPDSVTAIKDYAFSGCTGLTEITIPDQVTVIEEGVFSGCENLVRINIPETVTTIGARAFQYCFSLCQITIPQGVPAIELETFYNCESLTDLTIPDSVTSIGEGAFLNSGLTNITIPASVTSIEMTAFDNCTSLSVVRFLGSAPTEGRFFVDRACVTCYYSCTDESWADVYKNGDCMAWKGHLYDHYVYNQDATCTEDGTMTGQCPECGARETIIARETATGHTFGKDGRCITCGNGPELVVEISNCDKIHWNPGVLEVYEDDVLLATMTAPEGTTVRKVFPYDSQKTYRFVWATWLYNEEGSFRIWLNGHLLKTGTGWDYIAGDEVLALDPGCKHEYTKGYCPFCEKSLLLGDANSDGRVNMGDVASIYAHVRYTKQITDEDQLRCANVTGGIINLADVARLFAHITGRNKLY